MSECCTRSRLSLAQAIHCVWAPLQTRSNALCQLFVGATLQEPNRSKSRFLLPCSWPWLQILRSTSKEEGSSFIASEFWWSCAAQCSCNVFAWELHDYTS